MLTFNEAILKWTKPRCTLVSEPDPSQWGGRVWALAYIQVVPRTECWPDQSESLIANYVIEMVFFRLSVPPTTRYGKLLCCSVFYPSTWRKLTSRSATNVCVVSPQIASYHAQLHSVGTTRMWAHAQTHPPRCEGSGSETRCTHGNNVTTSQSWCTLGGVLHLPKICVRMLLYMLDDLISLQD